LEGEATTNQKTIEEKHVRIMKRAKSNRHAKTLFFSEAKKKDGIHLF
jgi:hypothetical protein